TSTISTFDALTGLPAAIWPSCPAFPCCLFMATSDSAPGVNCLPFGAFRLAQGHRSEAISIIPSKGLRLGAPAAADDRTRYLTQAQFRGLTSATVHLARHRQPDIIRCFAPCPNRRKHAARCPKTPPLPIPTTPLRGT